MEGGVDHTFAGPHIVHAVCSNPTVFAPVHQRLFGGFVSNINFAIFLFPLVVHLNQFLFGIVQVLHKVLEITEPAQLVPNDWSFGLSVDVQSDFDQSVAFCIFLCL